MTSTNDVRDIVNIDVVDQKQKDRLPDRLKAEFQDLEKQFVVDKSKLKAISARFQEELEEGLKANGSNIVSMQTSSSGERANVSRRCMSHGYWAFHQARKKGRT